MKRAFILWALVELFLVSVALGREARCPEGQVWGGHHCEWKDLCPDGNPAVRGRCRSDEAHQAAVSLQRIEVESLPPAAVPSQAEVPVQAPPPAEPPPAAARVRRAPTVAVIESAPMRPCEHQTVFDQRQDRNEMIKSGIFGGKRQMRRVVLTGGPASKLLGRYLHDAEADGLALNLARMEVIIFDDTGSREILVGGDQVRMTVGQMLGGMTWDRVWSKALEGRDSVAVTVPEDVASGLQADLVCGVAESASSFSTAVE